MGDKRLIQQFFEWQFAGDFPDVPLAPGIDIKALDETDLDPMFITLPIAQDNAVATDRMKYTPEFNSGALIGAIMDHRVEGNMGHLKPEDRPFKFDVPSVMWVGATRTDDGLIWGKAYIFQYERELRNYVRIAKAMNRPIATSIYGMADFESIEIDETDGTYTVKPDGFSLEYIDLAPPERAALPIDRRFEITSHLKKEDTIMDINEVLAQMKPEQINLLPKAVVDEVIAQFGKIEYAAELQTKLSDATVQIAQLNAKIAELGKDVFDSKLSDAVNKNVIIDDEDFRSTVRDLVTLHMGTDRDVTKIEEAITAVLAQPRYKKLADTFVAQMSGPNLGGGNGGTDQQKTAGEVFAENIDSVMSEYGVK